MELYIYIRACVRACARPRVCVHARARVCVCVFVCVRVCVYNVYIGLNELYHAFYRFIVQFK